MSSVDITLSNLLSPVVLAFLLGNLAVLLKSDLKIPDAIYTFLSIYLLLALGFKGGVALSEHSLLEIWKPSVFTLAISCGLALLNFLILTRIFRFNQTDAGAITAHYGSVSIVTFIVSKIFVENLNLNPSGYMTTLVTLMEVPGIVMGLYLGTKSIRNVSEVTGYKPSIFWELQKIFSSKSILVLLGGLGIGWISGQEGLKKVSPLFIDCFQGFLLLFMLDMGVASGSKISTLRQLKPPVITFALLLPLLNGSIGVLTSIMVLGFSMGNATIFGAICASASYIAAPTAVRAFMPEANTAYSLTPALLITFPFNIIFGIPIYYKLAVFVTCRFHA